MKLFIEIGSVNLLLDTHIFLHQKLQGICSQHFKTLILAGTALVNLQSTM
jgi:hypothetical protein